MHREGAETEKKMTVDVIIPVYRPGEAFLTLLDRLMRQTLPPRKIILMKTEDNAGETGAEGFWTGEKWREKYPNVIVERLPKEAFDHGGTRHRGVLCSDAPVFVTMTQDAMPADPYLLERLTQALTDKVAVSYARQLPGKDSDVAERISREFNYPAVSCVKTKEDLGRLGIKTFFCSNVCAAYRRDVYDALGGFCRHTIFNEDMIYAAAAVKAGYGIAYQARARVIHAHRYSNWQQLKRNFDLGVSQADHPEVFAGIVSESEGLQLMRQAWKYLRKRKKLYCFPGFFLQGCFKYAGYLLGKRYRLLPRKWILALTTNREYWN